jgi:SAM-dependent methyltransferase
MSAPAQQTPPKPAEIWSTGDYADVCDRMIPDLGARLVDLAEVGAGADVLDVAAGSGNAALPAAGAGATVTALDITPALLDAGSQRAEALELRVAWVEGDAQAMPFADASFDRVLSCVGVQFCADQPAAAGELVRVCRPGGRIGLIAWTREGFIGQVLAAVGQATGGGGPRSPLDWGSEDKLTELLGGRVTSALLQREHVDMPARSPEDWVDYMAQAYGPLARARAALDPGGRWEPLRARLSEIASAHDTGTGGAFSGRAEYLAAIFTRGD